MLWDANQRLSIQPVALVEYQNKDCAMEWVFLTERIIMQVLNINELKEGEVYIGAIINADGTGNHIILLPDDKTLGNWQEAMDWAKDKGGDLPNRVEQALLFNQNKDLFEEDWYWANTTVEGSADWAWCQAFLIGGQLTSIKVNGLCRARAVRRVGIK